MDKVYVLDSSAFIFGFSTSPPLKSYTTQEVVKEICKNEFTKTKIEIYVAQGSIEVISPPEDFLKKVLTVTQNTSDLKYLSKTDLSVIALALFLKKTLNQKVVLVSDDYAIQNAASILKIEFKSLKAKGIEKQIIWEIYCPACKRVFLNASILKCPFCGHKLKRKPKSKLAITKK
ncbi:MAG: PIN domain-containing protein [Nitrososphaeria archaeon]